MTVILFCKEKIKTCLYAFLKIQGILKTDKIDACLQRFSSLAAGGGIGKARTGAELPKSCEVSHETTPRRAKPPVARWHFQFLFSVF